MNADECVIPVFSKLTSVQNKKINDNSFVVSHRKGEDIFSENKPISYLMYISSGLVKIFKTISTDKKLILGITGPQKIIGLFSVFYADRYQFTATALEDCEIIYVSIAVLKEIMAENGHFALEIMQLFSKEALGLVTKLMIMPQKQVPGRIAEVLLYFSGSIYNSDQFNLPLSRQELADFIYSTKESISRTLTEFKNDKLIEIDDRDITIKSPDLLKILSKIG
jgi:CRP-like cAMP-binding protein